MALFLASVANAGEAEIAVRGGADLIDFKDPAKGALGALDHICVRSGVEAVAGRRSTSAVAGDLPMDPDSLALAVKSMGETGVDYVKIGLFDDPRRAECIASLAPLSAATRLIGVIFADEGAPASELIDQLATAGFHGAMLDTAQKGAGRLLDHCDSATLANFVQACQARGLLAGLAGSLEPPDVPRLLPLGPDILGFRGALCREADRKAGLDPAAVSLVRGLIPKDERGRPAYAKEESPVDYRLVARGYAVDLRDGASRTDRIFVRDFVLPVSIGAYRSERNATQRVRFDVDAFVQRATHPAADMRDVLSYDVITDAIRRIIATGHVELVEILAERIAGEVLGQPRVAKVVVRVEKLDLGPAAVGVEITREKTAEAAILPHLATVGSGEWGGTS